MKGRGASGQTQAARAMALWDQWRAVNKDRWPDMEPSLLRPVPIAQMPAAQLTNRAYCARYADWLVREYVKDDGNPHHPGTLDAYIQYLMQEAKAHERKIPDGVRDRQSKALFRMKRLFQQYHFSSWVITETDKLLWLRFHQDDIRVDLYQHVPDFMRAIDGDGSLSVGRQVVLPAMFTWAVRHHEASPGRDGDRARVRQARSVRDHDVQPGVGGEQAQDRRDGAGSGRE